jgi:hypothetical protein
MVHRIALAAIFFQAAITAALATQIMLHDQAVDARSPTDPLNLTAPVPVVDRQPIHTILVLNPNDFGAQD